MRNSDAHMLFYGVATVGERGQIVIPAEARRQHDINAGDKLMILGHPSGRALLIAKVHDFIRFVEHVQRFLALGTEGSKPTPEEDER